MTEATESTLERVVRYVERGENEQALGLLDGTGFALLEATLCESTWTRGQRARLRGADFAYWLLGRVPNREKARITPQLLAWTVPLRGFAGHAATPSLRNPFAVRSRLRLSR